MAKQKNNRTGTYILIGILCLIVGAFIIFCVNNFTEQKPYDVISCTFNKYNCNITAPQQDIPDWNGECTGEIVDTITITHSMPAAMSDSINYIKMQVSDRFAFPLGSGR